MAKQPTIKRATSNAAAKTVASRKPRTPKDDGIYWVISERTFLTWEPKLVVKNRTTALTIEANLERTSSTVMQRYKVSRVTLEV